MKSLLIVLCLALSCNANQSGENPGIQLKIKQSALDLVKEEILAIVNERLATVDFPIISGSSPVDYRIFNIKITRGSADLGTTNIRTTPPNVVTAVIDNARMAVTARFTASKRVRFFFFSRTFRINGRISASVSGLDISQSASIGVGGDGKPTVTAGQCSSRIGNFAATVSDTPFASIFSVAIRLFRSRIRDNINDRLCPAVKNLINEQVQSLTRQYSINFPFVFGTRINLGLVCQPVAMGDGILGSMRGRCYDPTNNPMQAFPFDAPDAPSLTPTSQMARISISTYVINTLLYSMNQQNLFRRTFTQDVILSALSISASDIGLLIPELAEFTDSIIQVVVEPTAPPTAQFNPDGVNIAASFVFNLEREENDIFVPFIGISLDVGVLADIGLVDGNIAGEIFNISAVATSSTGGFPIDVINDLLSGFIPVFILPALNGFVQVGFDLPTSYLNFGFENPTILFKENALEFGADFTRVD